MKYTAIFIISSNIFQLGYIQRLSRMSPWKVPRRWVQSKKITDDDLLLNINNSEGATDGIFSTNYSSDTSTTTLNTNQLRLFVGTWNVGGKEPTRETRESMQEWLMGSQQDSGSCTHQHAHIYVIGFQEIVPLNAGNILGMNMKDGSDAGLSASNKWEALISATLNKGPTTNHLNDIYGDSNDNEDDENDDADCGSKTITTKMSTPARTKDFYKNGDDKEQDIGDNTRSWDYCNGIPSTSASTEVPNDMRKLISLCELDSYLHCEELADSCMYKRIARKQMVGLFISVWVQHSLPYHVKAVQVSSVGCGIMNFLGNKGSVSVSLSVDETTFCFICSHLKSGDKPSDVSRRNIDVNNILHRTRFLCSNKLQSNANLNLPKTILAHDRIIWLGDLNYRLSLPPNELKTFLAHEDWEALIEKDELKREKDVGGVFEGWHEGPIFFAPTYKYRINSDIYCMVHAKEGSKRRAPAWCDRILWHGKGLKQLSYGRCESKLSDHRPVNSIFMVEVESLKRI